MATTLSVHRLSPGRIPPSRSGDGLPIATNSVLVASPYAGVIHIEPPPCCQASAYLAESAFSLAISRCRSSPSQVVLDHLPHQPPCTGSGSVYQVQAGVPLAALYAFTKPRMPYSAPERSEEHTSELQSQSNLVCRLLLEKKQQMRLQGAKA